MIVSRLLNIYKRYNLGVLYIFIRLLRISASVTHVFPVLGEFPIIRNRPGPRHFA